MRAGFGRSGPLAAPSECSWNRCKSSVSVSGFVESPFVFVRRFNDTHPAVDRLETPTPGGFRWQCVVAFVTLVALVATAGSAAAQGPRARLSLDLTAQLALPTVSSVDVIVSGNAAFVERLAERHGASVKKVLATGGVLRLSVEGLRTLADDPEAGAVTGDGVMRSHLALVTEQTGAAAAWAGEIAGLGAVMGTGVGVAIVDSGIDRHTALSGRVVATVDLTQRKGRGIDRYGHGTHVAGIVAASTPKVDTGAEPVGMAPGAHLINVKVLDETGTGTASASSRVSTG